MLPGNGTIVVEAVQRVLQAASGGGAALGGASGHACSCLTRLVKLCDDVLVHGEHSAELQPDNVHEVVLLLEQAVTELVEVARERRTTQKEALVPHPPMSSHVNSQQRNSLPDIALARDDRITLDQSFSTTPSQGQRLSRASHSTESVLRDSSPAPPPKPPLPQRPHAASPPPLPPKRRGHRRSQQV